jgi:hypothetical protein
MLVRCVTGRAAGKGSSLCGAGNLATKSRAGHGRTFAPAEHRRPKPRRSTLATVLVLVPALVGRLGLGLGPQFWPNLPRFAHRSRPYGAGGSLGVASTNT